MTPSRKEDVMNKNRVIGIGLIIISVVIAGVFITGKKYDEEKMAKADTETTTSIYIQETTTANEIASEIEVTTEIKTEKVTISDEKEVELIEKMKIKDVNDEVLQILECDNDTLYKVIQSFANGYGYANAKKAVYAGKCTINHIEDTKEATFYFYMKDKRTIYFDVILNRKSKKIFCELQ